MRLARVLSTHFRHSVRQPLTPIHLWQDRGIRNLIVNTFDRVSISVSGDEHHRHFADLS
jgi:hypothetical protein